jgi:hypothetical protein
MCCLLCLCCALIIDNYQRRSLKCIKLPYMKTAKRQLIISPKSHFCRIYGKSMGYMTMFTYGYT